MRIALVATAPVSEQIVCLLQDSTQTECNVTMLDGPDDAYSSILPGDFDIALIDFSIGGSHAIDLARRLSHDASHTPCVLLVDRYRETLDDIAQGAGALDWLDRRDVGGPLFRRCLRYVFTIHAMQQQLKQREIDLPEATEPSRRAGNVRAELVEWAWSEPRSPQAGTTQANRPAVSTLRARRVGTA